MQGDRAANHFGEIGSRSNNFCLTPKRQPAAAL